MKPFVHATSLCVLLLAAGCGSHQPVVEAPDDEGSVDALMVRTQFDQNARGGILAERTFYPYQFAPESAALNELGEHQVQVLASATRGAVRVNVARGNDSLQLHDARVQTVRSKLIEAGVAPTAVTVGDGPPGGLGLSSRAAMDVFEPAESKSSTTTTTEGARNRSSPSSGNSGASRGMSSDSYDKGFGGK